MIAHFCRRWHPPVALATPMTVSRRYASAAQHSQPPTAPRQLRLPLPSVHLCQLSWHLSASRTASERQTLSSILTQRLSVWPVNNIPLYYPQKMVRFKTVPGMTTVQTKTTVLQLFWVPVSDSWHLFSLRTGLSEQFTRSFLQHFCFWPTNISSLRALMYTAQ